MGLLGIGIGIVTTIKGIVDEDDELIQKGVKRAAFGTATLIVGDVAGFSDAAGEAFIENGV